MYGIFEISAVRKSHSFEGKTFESIEEVEEFVKDISVFFERDEENDAADFFSKFGIVYSVERITQ